MQDMEKEKAELRKSAQQTVTAWVEAKMAAAPTWSLLMVIGAAASLSWIQDFLNTVTIVVPILQGLSSLVGPYDSAVIGFPTAMATLELGRRCIAYFSASPSVDPTSRSGE